MVTVRKDLRLERQECPSGIDQVDARQPVLLSDLLSAEMLFHGDWEIGAALNRRIVRDDHALPALDGTYAGHNSRARGVAVVHLPRGKSAEFQERRCRINQGVDPFPREHFAPSAVLCDGILVATLLYPRNTLAQICNKGLVMCGVISKGR